MYQITRQDQPVLRYTLEDTSASSLIEVFPERGGIITRWQVQGQDLFYLDTERFKDPTLSVRGGIPILFPICGNLPGDIYPYQGQEYPLKQHGFARTLPWQVRSQDTNDQASLTLVLTSNEETLKQYPFEFELIFTYGLKGNKLTLQQQFKNLSTDPMPFSTGIHPYFVAPAKDQLECVIPSNRFKDQLVKEVQKFGGTFDFNLPEIDWAFRELTSQKATIYDAALGTRLEITWSPEYKTLVFWTVQNKDFYCLEPWTGPRSSLLSGEDLIVLDPGAALTLVITMEVKTESGPQS